MLVRGHHTLPPDPSSTNTAVGPIDNTTPTSATTRGRKTQDRPKTNGHDQRRLKRNVHQRCPTAFQPWGPHVLPRHDKTTRVDVPGRQTTDRHQHQ